MKQTKMKTVELIIPEIFYDKIVDLAFKTHKPISYFLTECILNHLEDIEDYYAALDAKNDENYEVYFNAE